MKTYEVRMNITFTKTLNVRATSARHAEVLAQATLLDTDAIALTDDDIIVLGVHASRYTGAESDCHYGDGPMDDTEEAVDSDDQMCLPEKLLHLSMCIEDVNDAMADVQASLCSIEEIAREILSCGNDTEIPEEGPEPPVQ